MAPVAGGPASSPGSLSAGYGTFLLTSLLVLVAVSVVAWVVVRFGARWLGAARAHGGLLSVVARVPLEPRRSLYVVEVAGKTLLVGTSEMGLSVLSELDGAVVRAQVEARPAGRSFGDALRAVMGRRAAAKAEVVAGEAAGVRGTASDDGDEPTSQMRRRRPAQPAVTLGGAAVDDAAGPVGSQRE